MEIFNKVLSNVTNEDIINNTFIVPDNVTTLDDKAFEDCRELIKVVIGDNVKSIGNYCFLKCTNLKEVIMSNSVTDIGIGAFSYTGIEEITLSNSLTYISEELFDNCSKLKKVNMSSNVTLIESYAFSSCNFLTDFIILDSINFLGEGIFQDCINLQNVKMSKNITVIPDFTFMGCTSLKKLDISSKITNVGDRAFSECNNLIDFKFIENVKRIGEYAFFDCQKLSGTLNLNNAIYIKNNAFLNCHNINNIKLSDKLKKIDKESFKDCVNLNSIYLPDNLLTLYKDSFLNCNIKNIDTLYGNYKKDNVLTGKEIISSYLYLYVNSISKNKYNNLDEFIKNNYINELLDSNIIYNDNSISKFKKLYFKLRKDYDISVNLFKHLDSEIVDKFNLKVWNKIKDIINYNDDEELSLIFTKMIGTFGLFENDSLRNNRIDYFKDLFFYREYVINEDSFFNLDDKLKKCFEYKNNLYYILNNDVIVPYEYQVYLKDILSDRERKKIKKLTGSFGKKINDFVKDNYSLEYIGEYKLVDKSSEIRNNLFNLDIDNQLNRFSLLRIFSGCSGKFNSDFFEFFKSNFYGFIRNREYQDKLKDIEKNFTNIKNYYLINSGVKDITLKQGIDFLNEQSFEYNEGNYEFSIDAKNAGVKSQKAFDYYQAIYENNDIRRMNSLIRRSNIYEIDGYILKGELLRRDDSYGMLMGEANYTKNCQVYDGVGHNCMAHAVNSDDGGIFVVKLFKDDIWIILTASWNWQNNNLYCHDNIEGSDYFKKSSSNLKKAVSEVYRLDGEYIIEKSKNEVEKYIKMRKRIIDKSISGNKDDELKKLKELEQREVIKVVTIGGSNNCFNLSEYFTSSITVDEDRFIDGKKFSLKNFQPVNYDLSKPYFNFEKTAYTDSEKTQYIIAGSLEKLCENKLEPLIPIYRDDRRIFHEKKDAIRDYTINKVKNISKKMDIDKINEENIILGEDWYLIYDVHDDNSISILDIVKTNPELDDENSKQIQEIIKEVYNLVEKYEQINITVKEDKVYLLYLINKKLGYFKQIGEDEIYSSAGDYFGSFSSKEQDNLLRNIDKVKNNKDIRNVIHKISFKKGDNFMYDSDKKIK